MKKKLFNFFIAFFIVINVFFGSFTSLAAETISNEESTTSEAAELATNENDIQDTEGQSTTNNSATTPSITPYVATDIDVNLGGIAFSSAGASSEFGDPLDILSGNQVLVRTVFGVNASDVIGARQLMFRVELPENSGFIAATSDVVDYKSGGPNGPDDTPVPGKEYVWIIYRQEMHAGTGKSFSFYINPSVNGVTPNDTQYNIKIQGYDGVAMQPVGNESTNYVNATVPKFEWNNVSTSVGGGIFDSQGAANIPTISVRYVSSPKYASGDKGISYANQLYFEDSYEVPTAADGTPLVLLPVTGGNLFYTDGTALVENVDYKVDASNGGYITKFTIMRTIDNTNPTAEIATKETTFRIQNALLNSAKIISEYGLAANQTSPYFYLKSLGSNHTVTPLVDVETIGTTPQALAQTSNPSIRFSFKNTLETGDETNDQNKFQKNIIKIGNTGTSGTVNDKLAAYPDDLIVYQFGANIKNYQKTALDYLTFTEEVGTGYDATEMAPQKVTTGTYVVGTVAPTTAVLTVTISFGSNPSIVRTYSGTDLQSSKTINIPANFTEDVTKIEYKFTDVDANFSVKTPPTMTFRTLKQIDETKTGSKFTNEAVLAYQYTNPDFGGAVINHSQDATAFYYYKEKDTDAGLFKSNKNATNLARGSYPAQNDVLLFEITMTNVESAPWNIKTVEDLYTYNLSAYNGTTVINGDPSSAAIDPQYLSSQVSNMVVWDPADNTIPYSNQGIMSVIDTPAVAPGRGTLDISFTGTGIVVQPGETLKLTYTMNTNSDFVSGQTLGNTFVAYNDNGNAEATGEFWWSIPLPNLTDPNRNKTWENATAGLTSEAPFPDDVVAFTLIMTNDTGEDWTDQLIIEDNYDPYLLPYGGPSYGGLAGIPTSYPSYGKLDPTKELNLGVASAPAGFDASQMTIVLDESSHKFTIDLGNNEILDGEELRLIYTMQVRADVVSKQKLVNRFTLKNGIFTVVSGRCELTTNQFIGKSGIVDIVKSAAPVTNDNGTTPNTTRLIEGEKVKYTIDLTNYRNRPTQKVNLKNFEDYLPDNLKYVDSTAKIFLIEYNGAGTETSRTELVENTDFTVSYPFASDPLNNDNQISVKLNSAQELVGREYIANILQKRTKIVLEYQAVVDLESADFPAISSPNRTVERQNNINAFFLETPSKISNYKSGGAIVEDTTDLDNDPTTHAIIDSSAKVSVANNKMLFGNISKSATQNKALNVDSGDNTRKYAITLQNYSVAPLPMDKVIDILPNFETFDLTVPVQFHTATNVYDAVYTIESFIDANGDTIEKMIVTGYKDEFNVVQPIVVDRTSDISIPVQYKITYGTTIDTHRARTLMQLNDRDTLSYRNNVAAYLDPSLTFTITGTPAATKVITDDQPDNDWDNDPSTTIRYQNYDTVTLTSNYISPFINIKGQKVFVNSSGTLETYQDYVAGVTTVNPGDVIAWKINVGNSNQTNTKTIKAGTKLVVILANGLSYNGYAWNSSGVEVIPSFLNNPPEIRTDAHNNTVLIWETTTDIPKGTDLNFTIRVGTQENIYATYGATAYFVPSEASDQYFYNNTIAAASEYTRYSYKGEWKDIRGILSDRGAESHYVISQNQMDVYGELGISSLFQITDQTGQANPVTITSRDAGQRIMDLTDRDDTVRYGMRLNVEKADKGFTEPVFINRLPSVSDAYSQEPRNRGSEADVRLIGDGSFTAEIRNVTTNALITTLTEGVDYEIEYFFGDVNEQFTTADWGGVVDPGRWLDQSVVVANGLDFADVTAIRYRMLTPGYTIPKGQSLFVSYDAKLTNYQVGGKEALNSFGYSGRIGTTTFVNAEPLYVGVRAPLLKDRVVVEKLLLDSNATPQLDTFSMDLVGKDASDVEQYRQTFSITTDDFIDTDSDGVNDTWKGIENVYELPLGLTYSIEEPAIADYEAPIYQVDSTTYADGTTEWKLTVTNEPIYYADVTIKKVLNEDTVTPTQTAFVVDLIAKDNTGTEVSRTPQTINLVQNGTIWEGSVTLNKLDVSLDYSIEEQNTTHYVPTYSVTSQDVAYGKSWELVVTNDTIFEDEVTITKTLHENTDTPTESTFTIDLVAKDSAGTEVSRTPYTFDLQKNGSVWEATQTIVALEHGLTYSVEEQNTEHYTVEYQESNRALQYGTAWTFNVDNTPILEDEITITKVLNENHATPKQTTFTIDLIGKDASGTEVSRTPYTLDLQRNGSVWEATETITGLTHGITYSVEEQATPEYTVEYNSSSTPIQYGTAWTFEVKNTPILEDAVTITKILHDNTDTPERTKFVIDLVAKDANGTEVSRIPYTLNLVQNEDVWEATQTITGLTHGLTYSVEEQNVENYDVVYALEKAELQYGTNWDFIVNNTKKIPDLGNELKQTGENISLTIVASAIVLALSFIMYLIIKKIRQLKEL